MFHIAEGQYKWLVLQNGRVLSDHYICIRPQHAGLAYTQYKGCCFLEHTSSKDTQEPSHYKSSLQTGAFCRLEVGSPGIALWLHRYVTGCTSPRRGPGLGLAAAHVMEPMVFVGKCLQAFTAHLSESGISDWVRGLCRTTLRTERRKHKEGQCGLCATINNATMKQLQRRLSFVRLILWISGCDKLAIPAMLEIGEGWR